MRVNYHSHGARVPLNFNLLNSSHEKHTMRKKKMVTVHAIDSTQEAEVRWSLLFDLSGQHTEIRSQKTNQTKSNSVMLISCVLFTYVVSIRKRCNIDQIICPFTKRNEIRVSHSNDPSFRYWWLGVANTIFLSILYERRLEIRKHIQQVLTMLTEHCITASY